MHRTLILAVSVSLATPSIAAHTGYYRFPALHGDTLVFCSEGDLWVTDVTEGSARRLTTHPDEETRPALSPDGTLVAFAAAYEGPAEVYVMPVAGGVPTRLTFGADRPQVAGWTADGDVLYASRHRSTLPDWQLFTVDVETGDHAPIPLAQASDGVYGDDGRLFFTRFAFQGSSTKRYKGGTARSLWVYADGAAEAQPLTTDHTGEDIDPMWWSGRVYFASERSGSMNIWSMRPDGSDPRQHTDHDAFDVKAPVLSDGRIVYQHGADLRLLDLATGLSIALEIDLVTDLDQLRERWIDEPAEWLTSVDLDAKGERLVLTARGEIFIVPAKGGRIVHVARNHGVRYREAHFMPDGERVLALSDESGELDHWTFRADGYGEPVQVTDDATVHRMGTVISDDGKWIAWHDKDLVLWVRHLEREGSTRVASASVETFRDLLFSPDSRWLAYVVPADNGFSRIHLYELASGTGHVLTSDRVHSRSPVFAGDGSWLYFLSDRHFETLVPSPWGDYQPEPYLVRKTGIFALDLTGARRSPFAAADELATGGSDDDDSNDDDDDKEDGSEAEEHAAEGGASKGETAAPAAPVYDLTAVTGRIVRVPVPAANRSALGISGDALFWLERAVGSSSASLRRQDRQRAPGQGRDRRGEGAPVRALARRHEAVRRSRREGDVDRGREAREGGPEEGGGGSVPLAIAAGPPRGVRPDVQRVMAPASRLLLRSEHARHRLAGDAREYAPLAARVASRQELNDVIAQMVGELSALHTYVVRGDMREGTDQIELGALGAVLERDRPRGGWRIAHIWRADPELPSRQSPLVRADLDVREDDVVTHINGSATVDLRDPGVLLRDQAGRQVRLRLAGRDGEESRDIVVVPMTLRAERNLRYDEWERTRREMIEAWSEGAMGYVHVRSMGGANYANDFARNFYPVFDRQGLVVDMRHNTGGNIDSWLLARLMRRAWMYWKDRAGDPTWNMQHAFRGHMVVLCDEKTASDGEAFCAGFRRLGLGKAIGTRTWGGEIWLSFSNELVDKGIASAAEYGVYGPEGEWLIEGWGFEPDIVVDNLPVATWRGEDAQLRAAFEHLERLIEADPRPVPPPPPHPDLSRP